MRKSCGGRPSARGSQRRAGSGRHARLLGGGRFRGQPRIVTSRPAGGAAQDWRSPSGRHRGSQQVDGRWDRGHSAGGGCPPLARFATPRVWRARPAPATVAVTLQSDRGSQPLGARRFGLSAGRWRSLSGESEDRNSQFLMVCSVTPKWRSPFGATEDGNGDVPVAIGRKPSWRSASGAAEDRNNRSVAAEAREAQGGGRSPGRPRIATPVRSCAARSQSRWRSPFGATGYRNSHTIVSAACPVSCNGRPPGRSRIATTISRWTGKCRSGGGRPPGRPRIATSLSGYGAWPFSCGVRPSGRPGIATTPD